MGTKAHEVERMVLTPEELGEALDVSPDTLRGWRYRGCGPPYVKLGNGGMTAPIRYPVDLLREWIAERVRTSTADEGNGNGVA